MLVLQRIVEVASSLVVHVTDSATEETIEATIFETTGGVVSEMTTTGSEFVVKVASEEFVRFPDASREATSWTIRIAPFPLHP